MNTNKEAIINLIQQEVVPAIGCTEPMAVALCTARATEMLGCRPEKITAQLSGNILKNAMGVGIPGTGMIGLPIAIALGALIGKSEYQLEVLKDLTPEALEEGKRFVAEGRIHIGVKPDICELLYIEITCEAAGKSETAIIEGSHTKFRSLEPEDNSQLSTFNSQLSTHNPQLTFRAVYDFAMETPVEDLRFILKTRDLNMQAAREALKHNYGHNLGKTIERPLAKGIFGNSIYSH
ncbi:MAG: serine dehydratase subunit alpha family protein, partial [Prevotella sp.]|nr:serine dehydratase subunit alpha family protein [Prevotella sp.]